MRFPTKFNKVLKELYTPDEIKEIKSFINQTQVVKESYNKHANKLNLPTLPNITNYGMRQKGYIKMRYKHIKAKLKHIQKQVEPQQKLVIFKIYQTIYI